MSEKLLPCRSPWKLEAAASYMTLRPVGHKEAWVTIEADLLDECFLVSLRRFSPTQDEGEHILFDFGGPFFKIPFDHFPNGRPPAEGGWAEHFFSPTEVTHVVIGDRAKNREFCLQLDHVQPDPDVPSSLLAVTAFVNGDFCTQAFVDVPEFFPGSDLSVRPMPPFGLTHPASPFNTWI